MAETLIINGAEITTEHSMVADEKVFSDEVYVVKANGGYEIKRAIKNLSDKPAKLKELAFLCKGFSFGKDAEAKDDYFYANENARLYGTLAVSLDKFPEATKWCDPDSAYGRICSCPYQPFPAILISNYKSKKGAVAGSLSQSVFYHSFAVGHKDGKAFLEVYSAFKDIDERVVLPGETLADEWFIGDKDNADDINDIFSPYTGALRKRLAGAAGASEINRHTLIWDSWNDGIYRDVSEEMLLKEAKAVKENFPNAEWFQLDDGYSTYCEENVDLDAHGLGVPYEGDAGVDKEKFPHGLKYYTDEIKKLGLRPAVWIGGFCPVKSEIYKEHPEWFIDLRYRVDFSQPLDPSISEVREYMTRALDTFVAEYGFEGIKHDFWTYAFEDKHDLLKNKDKSGYEWREWWQKEIKKRLPDYGYVETGCDIGMGNPFIGKYFNNYRFGLDVGAGKWDNVKTVMFWAVAVLSHQTGDLFIPNSDSAGLLPGLNDTDFKFIMNFQIITRTLVEISGRFSSVDKNNPRLACLKRAVKYLDNGENVYFANYDYRKAGENLPEIIYINSAFDAPDNEYKTVALFNASEKEKTISFVGADIGLPGEKEYENVWGGEKIISDGLSVVLPAHGSALYKAKKD